MPESISPAEAAEALRQIEASRAAFRSAIGAARGYQHLWVWGVVWVIQSVAFGVHGHGSWLWANAASVLGFVGSTVIGVSCSRRVRTPIDKRYLAALATVILFGILIWPMLLMAGVRLQVTTIYAYSALVAMQAYIISGIWFDNHLLWVGVIVTAFIMIGYFFLLPYFWWWMAAFGGGTLIASGFYVRHAWK